MTPCTPHLQPTHYALLPTPYSLLPTPYPYSLLLTPYSLLSNFHSPLTIHHSPLTTHHSPAHLPTTHMLACSHAHLPTCSLQDDFADLAEEEASLGNKTDSDLREWASYYHLQYCAGRILAFIDWQPQSKGVVAVSCAQKLAFEERVQVRRRGLLATIPISPWMEPQLPISHHRQK